MGSLTPPHIRAENPFHGRLAMLDVLGSKRSSSPTHASLDERLERASWFGMGQTLRSSWKILLGHFHFKRTEKALRPLLLDQDRSLTTQQKINVIDAFDGVSSHLFKRLFSFLWLAFRLLISLLSILLTPCYLLYGLIRSLITKDKTHGLHTLDGQNKFLNLLLVGPQTLRQKNKRVDFRKQLKKYKIFVTIGICVFPLTLIVGALTLPFIQYASYMHHHQPLPEKQPLLMAALRGAVHALKTLFFPILLLLQILHALFQSLLYALGLSLRQPAYLLLPITLAWAALTTVHALSAAIPSLTSPLNLLIHAINPQAYFVQSTSLCLLILTSLMATSILLLVYDRKKQPFPWKAGLLLMAIGVIGSLIILSPTFRPILMLTPAHQHLILITALIGTLLTLTSLMFFTSKPSFLPKIRALFLPPLTPNVTHGPYSKPNPYPSFQLQKDEKRRPVGPQNNPSLSSHEKTSQPSQ